jgi:hypothetical protein
VLDAKALRLLLLPGALPAQAHGGQRQPVVRVLKQGRVGVEGGWWCQQLRPGAASAAPGGSEGGLGRREAAGWPLPAAAAAQRRQGGQVSSQSGPRPAAPPAAPTLRQTMSQLPVWARAIIMARSLASLPLLTKYTLCGRGSSRRSGPCSSSPAHAGSPLHAACHAPSPSACLYLSAAVP